MEFQIVNSAYANTIETIFQITSNHPLTLRDCSFAHCRSQTEGAIFFFKPSPDTQQCIVNTICCNDCASSGNTALFITFGYQKKQLFRFVTIFDAEAQHLNIWTATECVCSVSNMNQTNARTGLYGACCELSPPLDASSTISFTLFRNCRGLSCLYIGYDINGAYSGNVNFDSVSFLELTVTEGEGSCFIHGNHQAQSIDFAKCVFADVAFTQFKSEHFTGGAHLITLRDCYVDHTFAVDGTACQLIDVKSNQFHIDNYFVPLHACAINRTRELRLPVLKVAHLIVLLD